MRRLQAAICRNGEFVQFYSQNVLSCSTSANFSTYCQARQRHITKRQGGGTLLNKKTELTTHAQARTLNPQRQAIAVEELAETPILETKQPAKLISVNDVLESFRKQQQLMRESGGGSSAEDHTQEVSICLRDIDSIVTLKINPQSSIASQASTLSGNNLRVVSFDEHMWPSVSIDKLAKHYARLAKLKLSLMVVITAAAGYAVAPGVLELSTLVYCSAGTALQSAAANSINQILEVPYDSQMNRTKMRPLVQGQLSPLHAAMFAGATCALGTGLLLAGTNVLTAGLGLFNVALYTALYTPMKRTSIANTWVGAVVGAVPPLMGWAACTGGLEPGAFVLAAIMYAWQFPHFNSLSWNLRADYSRAGYRMTSVVDPDLCRRVALRYSLVIGAICAAAPLLDVTTWTFAATTFPVNAYVAYLSWRFYKQADSNSARKLFRASLAHVPLLLILMYASKKRLEDGGKQHASETAVAAATTTLQHS